MEKSQTMEATFSMLTMSLASSAAMSLGLSPDPNSGKIEKNKELSKFNIDLLVMLQKKSTGNLSSDEKQFLDSVVSDLQVKFVQTKWD
jgi:hypothetical protein